MLRFVVGITDAAGRGDEFGLGQALGMVHRKILNSPVAMVDQSIIEIWPADMNRLLQGIENDAGSG